MTRPKFETQIFCTRDERIIAGATGRYYLNCAAFNCFIRTLRKNVLLNVDLNKNAHILQLDQNLASTESLDVKNSGRNNAKLTHI